MVGCTDALCTVVCFVLQIAEGECVRGELVLVSRCFTCNQAALKIGVLSDQEIKAALSYEDAGLVSGAPIVGVDRSFAEGAADVGLCKGAGSYLFDFLIRSRDLVFCCIHIPRGAKACRGVLLLVELFLILKSRGSCPFRFGGIRYRGQDRSRRKGQRFVICDNLVL